MAGFRTWPRTCPDQHTHQLWLESVELCRSYWTETKSVTIQGKKLDFSAKMHFSLKNPGHTWLVFELGRELVQINAHTNFGWNRLNFVEVIGRKRKCDGRNDGKANS